MTISVSPELVTLVEQQMATGQFESTDDVLRAALELLQERNRRVGELREEILPSLERLDHGEGIPLDMAAIKAEARASFQKAKAGADER
jgi:putative addiction module CopG family antidote